MALAFTARTKAQELAETRVKLEQADERVRDLEASLVVKTSSIELDRATDRLRALQAIDVTQRKGLDRLSEENFRLRRLLKTNGYDMEAVEVLMNEIKPRPDTADTQE